MYSSTVKHNIQDLLGYNWILYVVFDGWTMCKLTVNINTMGCPLSK